MPINGYSGKRNYGITYQFLGELGEVQEAIIHVILWSAQSDDVALLSRVGQRNLHLIELVTDLLDRLAPLPNQLLVEPLLDEDVPRLLIILHNHKRAVDE